MKEYKKESFNYLKIENSIYKLQRIITLFDFVRKTIGEGNNVIDLDELDDALYEIVLSEQEALSTIKSNFNELMLFLKQTEMNNKNKVEEK